MPAAGGILRRVVVIDIGEGAFELINPVMTEKSGEQECVEGCLSVPGKRGKTRRPARVTVEAFDHRGNPVRIEGEGLLALALCHELDHLDGKLYIDIARGRLGGGRVRVVLPGHAGVCGASLRMLLREGYGSRRLCVSPTGPSGRGGRLTPVRQPPRLDAGLRVLSFSGFAAPRESPRCGRSLPTS